MMNEKVSISLTLCVFSDDNLITVQPENKQIIHRQKKQIGTVLFQLEEMPVHCFHDMLEGTNLST